MAKGFLSWPFFEPSHRELADDLQTWCEESLPEPAGDLDEDCRTLVAELGISRLPQAMRCERRPRPDVRSLAIARETLAYHSALADFAFAMQGLGSGAISLFGTVEQKRAWLPEVAAARRLRPSR
jgi:acyl-CoA dehydrogenase